MIFECDKLSLNADYGGKDWSKIHKVFDNLTVTIPWIHSKAQNLPVESVVWPPAVRLQRALTEHRDTGGRRTTLFPQKAYKSSKSKISF